MKSKGIVIFCLVFYAVVLVVGNVLGQEADSVHPVHTVYTIYIPGLLKQDLTGPFVDLNKEISRRAKVQLVFEIVPPKRQRISFHEKKYDIIFPMVPSSFKNKASYQRSSAFYVKKYYAFTRKGMPLVATLSDLEQIQGAIGLTRGYSYPEELLSNPKLTFDLANADDHNMLKLKSGRIASFIVEEISGLQAIKKTNLGQIIQYDPAAALFTEDVFYAFQPEARLNGVKAAISQAIDEMKDDGSLKKILAVLQPTV